MGGGVRRRGGHRSRKSAPEADESAAPLAAAAPVQPKRGSARSSQGIKPSAEEVLLAIDSLYVDELKPFGRILRKRVAEQHVERHDLATGGNLPDVDIKHLKAMCDGNSQLEVQPEEGGDWSAMIKGRPAHFIDIYSSEDNYESATWDAARKYFESLPEDMALLPGGRYSCAQALMDRNLDFLAGLSLGKVCHLVQLAISTHKTLGYCNGAVVPYSRSQSKVKEDCAVFGQPCQSSADALGAVPAGAPSLTLATWQVARSCLREVLESAAVPDSTGPASVPLSNVKRLFRSKYQIELSETSLGHSKLSELLQDARFSDICEVQLQGQGYIVVQVDRPEAKDTENTCIDGHPISLSGGLLPPWDRVHPLDQLLLTPVRASSPMDEPDGFESYCRQEFCPEEPLNLEDAGLLPGTCSGNPSPLQPLPTPLGSPGAPTPNTVSRWPAYAQMWHSTGPSELYGSEASHGACSAQAASWNWPQHPSLPMGASWVDTQCAMFDHGASDSTESTADSAHSVACRSSRAVQSPTSSSCLGRLGEPQSPSPDDPPMKISLMRAFDEQADTLLQLAQMPLGEELDEPRSRVPFCPDEPLILEDAGFFEGAPKVLSGIDSDVKNTFIQMATTPLVTPQPGALRRSRSVPKDVGCSQEDAMAPASRAQTPAFVLPPTPSSPAYCTSYEVMADPSLDPLNALNRVIRLADLI
eukprot:TRINITY_DN22494_c0_g2_i1.p1 TRINITY_DN22494_c0_g2~~TRINITY_DN22494_c0_g2_i1.p1  ORF type:complete len:719 (-),score=121.76 TRINITY_DN22494_c0_g2_i1:167-2263(-)